MMRSSRAASSRRLSSRLIFKIVGERLPVGVADDEALPTELRVGVIGRLGRREAALGLAAIEYLGRNLQTPLGIPQQVEHSLTDLGTLQQS
jgi:hypothetical protein